MPQPTKIPRAFASSGDKNVIPESTGSIGLASWTEGFPAITSTPFAQGGIAPKRADFNGIFNALSAATVWQQQGGVFAYDNTTDYEPGNVVLYSDELFLCIVANGPGSSVKNPTDMATWAQLISAKGGTISGTLVFSGGNDIRSDANDKQIVLLAGMNANSTSGAKVILNGGSYTGGTPGQFMFQAGDANGYKQFVGAPDGTLTWDGSDIFTVGNSPISSDVSAQPYTYKVKFANGAMIQAVYSSFTTNSYSRIEWTYPEAFLEFPFVCVLKVSPSRTVNFYSGSKTKVILRCNDMSGAVVGEGDTSSYMIIAVGRWQ